MSKTRFGQLAIVLMAAAWSGAASAAPFTWNPSALFAGAGSAFTADGIVATDYLYTQQPAANNVPYTNTIIYRVTGFTLGGAAVATPGLGTSYALYFRADETDVVIAGVATTIGGTVRLVADPTNNDGTLSTTLATQIAFSNPGGTADDVTLASGSILSGSLRIPATGPISKFLLSEFDASPTASAFFLSPAGNHVQLELLNTNTATSRQTLVQSDGSAITLVNGAVGAIDLTVPEPASLTLVAVGIFGLVGLGRRSNQSRRSREVC